MTQTAAYNTLEQMKNAVDGQIETNKLSIARAKATITTLSTQNEELSAQAEVYSKAMGKLYDPDLDDSAGVTEANPDERVEHPDGVQSA